MTDPADHATIGPQGPKPIQIAGQTEPPAKPTASRAPSAQVRAAALYFDTMAEDRVRFYTETQDLKAKNDENRDKIDTLSKNNGVLEADCRHFRQELRASRLSLALAGAMAVVGSTVVSYTTENTTRFVALIVTICGAVWCLWQGVVSLGKDDREPATNRWPGFILVGVIVLILALNYHNMVTFLYDLVAGQSPP
ncbi:MAG: hypothetical protein IMZ62_01390 [Chloroflexi bacterium]|nr:hypothetical protein [Chloroflexota bacterium]